MKKIFLIAALLITFFTYSQVTILGGTVSDGNTDQQQLSISVNQDTLKLQNSMSVLLNNLNYVDLNSIETLSNKTLDNTNTFGLDVTNFNNNLSGTDTNVQTAMETLDELVSGSGASLEALTQAEFDLLTAPQQAAYTGIIVDDAGNPSNVFSEILLLGSTSGTATITAPAVAGTPTITLPTTDLDLAYVVIEHPESDQTVRIAVADDQASADAMTLLAGDVVACRTCSPMKVIPSATWDTDNGAVTVDGLMGVDERTVDEATWTFSSFDSGDEISIYTNRASAPTLAGTGLTFNALPNSDGHVAATEQVYTFYGTAIADEIDYLVTSRE